MADALISSGRTAEEAWNNQELYGSWIGNAGGMSGVNGLIVMLNNFPDPSTDGTVKDGIWTVDYDGTTYNFDLTSTTSYSDGGTNIIGLRYLDFVVNTDVDYEDLVTALNTAHPANGLSLSEGQKKSIEAMYVLNKAGIGGDCSTDAEKTALLTAYANFEEMDSGAQDAVLNALKDVDVTITTNSAGTIAYGTQEAATDTEKAIAKLVADGNSFIMNNTADLATAISGSDKFVTISEGGTADDFTSAEITAMKSAGETWLTISTEDRQAMLDSGLVTQTQADAWVAAAYVDHVGGWSPPDGESYMVWAAKAEGQGFSPQQWAGFTHNVSNFQGGTYYYTHTRYHYITDLRDSATAAELEAAHDMGVLTDEQWDMIQMSYAFDTTDGNQYEKADALAFIYGTMSDADRTRTIAVLSLGGDDAEDLAQWLVDNVGNQPSIDGIANCATEYEAAGYAANFTSTEIIARYGEDSPTGDRLLVASMLYNSGVSEDEYTTAMASFDELSDLDQAYIIEQAKTRDTKQSDFYGDLGLVPDYTQSSMTYKSESPSSAQSAISAYLVAGGVDTGVTVQDYVSVYAASDDDDTNIIQFDHAPDIDLATEEQVRDFCESAVTNWDDLTTEQQDAIIAYQVAVANPDYSSDDDGNIVDGDGTIVARALTQDYMDELGMTDDQELDLVSSMTLALNGRASAQEARVRYYTESVDDANKCMAAGNEVVQGLSDNEPSDDGTFDISTLSVTYDGQTMDYATWCVSEGISLNGADPSAMTASEMESLEERVGLYVDNKSADSETDKLKLQQAEQYYENTISMWTNFNELWGDMLNSIAEGYGAVARA